jgi:flagellar hook-length control protein FliK
MFQMPLLGAGAQGLTKPSARGPADGSGLAGVPQAGDGATAGFSGDLQALLMQLSPQMLQRLEELLAGGMDLPQAASTLLGEADMAPCDEPFTGFLQARLPLAKELPAGPGAVPGQFAAGLEAAVSGTEDLAAVRAVLPAFASVQAVAQGPGTRQLPSPLATSLLDMGVPQQVGGRGWDAAISDRVMWMLQGEQQFARLKLNPPNLGPLEVRLSVHQDQASVTFLAPQAAVREALEAALPRLREMFDQQSLQLVRADVGDTGAQQRGRTQDPGTGGGSRTGRWGGESAEGTEDSVAGATRVAAGIGLIDLFA